MPLLAALLLAACYNDDDPAGQPLPPGEHPMTFTATGIALNVETKATTDNNWQDVAQVSVQVGSEVKTYDVQSTSADSYQTATLTSQDPFYWQNTAPVTVSAWYPCGNTQPAVVVKANQSQRADYDASDYTSATGTMTFGGNNTLQFTHRTAKVVVKPLEAGSGVSVDELTDATITLVGVSTGNPADGNTVTPYDDGNNHLALLPPQDIAQDKPFIQVTLKGGATYSYRPDKAVTLQEGCQYTYTITVKKTGLEGSASISGWDNTTPAISGEAEPLTHTYDQATNTYTVYTAQGLQAWAAAAESDRDANCTLAADIDMAGQSWTTISTNYYGTFDGAGHTISQISGGLFENVATGTVKNLTIQDASVSSSDGYVGMIAGEVVTGNIENCHVMGGTVTGNYAGGIVGMIYPPGTVRACSSSATVNGSTYAGGITGLNSGTILSCHATGTAISTTSFLVGAIASVNEGAIIACYWSGASANGIGSSTSSSTSSEAEKTSDWQTAAEAMNNALPDDFGWMWQTSDADTPPVMVKKE